METTGEAGAQGEPGNEAGEEVEQGADPEGKQKLSAKEAKARQEMNGAITLIKKVVSRYNEAVSGARKTEQLITAGTGGWGRWNTPDFVGKLRGLLEELDSKASSETAEMFLQGGDIVKIIAAQKKKLGSKAFVARAKELESTMLKEVEDLASWNNTLHSMQMGAAAA